jgi:hypothetical protein
VRSQVPGPKQKQRQESEEEQANSTIDHRQSEASYDTGGQTQDKTATSQDVAPTALEGEERDRGSPKRQPAAAHVQTLKDRAVEGLSHVPAWRHQSRVELPNDLRISCKR